MALLSPEYILSAFLIFVRVGSMIMVAPFFSAAVFPVRVKLFFALMTSFLLFPAIPAQSVMVDPESGIIFMLMAIIQEVLTGVALGLVGQLVFAGLDLAGRLISIQVALSFANVVDSMTQQQSSVVSNMFNLLAILIFLSIGGDKIYILALAHSFEHIPVSTAQLASASPLFLEMATYLFITGVQIASPFLVVLFMLNLSFAIFARIMPQANIFFIALPVKLGVGMILLVLVVPYLPIAFDIMFQRLFEYLSMMIELLTP
ncbi:flagellar biosynthetic protein FliR [Balneolales bacterium ANBcel1]|nr:flagellar biosynthetic protein FliR [Balneolales bacterium ANBcel1]